MSSRIPARASSRRRSARAAVRVILLSLVVMAGTTAPTLAQAPAEKAPAGPTGGGAKARIQLLELRDVEVQTAADLIAAETGLNIVPSTEAGAVRVSLTLRGVTARQALDALCQASDLWVSEDKDSGILRIRTTDEYRRDVRSFRSDRIETFTLLYPNAVDVALAIQSLFGSRVVLGFGQSPFQVTQELQQRFQRFDVVDQRSQGLGQFNGGGNNGFNQGANGLGGFGGAGLGGAGGFGGQGFGRRQGFGGRGGQAGSTREDRGIDLGRGRVEGLSAEQIDAIERAEREGGKSAVLERLLDRTTIHVSVIERLNKVVVRSGDERVMEQIRALIRRLDVPTPSVLLEVKVLAIDLRDDFNSVFDYQFSDGSSSSAGFTTGDVLPPGSDAVAGDALRRTLSLTPGGTGLQNGNVIYQFVSSHFRARVQLLENKNRVTVLATPVLLTANNEVSRLFVGEERPLNRSFTGPQFVNNVLGNGQTAAGSTGIEFRPIGTTLLITPNINADRTVTLRILQETSAISPNPARILVPTNTGFTPQDVDIVQTRTVSGTVVAKDGLTVALGGLIDESVSDRRAEVPWLGRIPVLGFFFRRETRERTRQEVVVLIRPFVLNTPAEGPERTRKLLEELSIHPSAPNPTGALGTFQPDEVLRPAPPKTGLRKLLRFHTIDLEGDE